MQDADYSDIINMPHHVSSRRKHMSMRDRAGQFAPFAALTGYDEVISDADAENERKMLADVDLIEADDI